MCHDFQQLLHIHNVHKVQLPHPPAQLHFLCLSVDTGTSMMPQVEGALMAAHPLCPKSSAPTHFCTSARHTLAC